MHVGVDSDGPVPGVVSTAGRKYSKCLMITGVQPKLSMEIKFVKNHAIPPRLTIASLWGGSGINLSNANPGSCRGGISA